MTARSVLMAAALVLAAAPPAGATASLLKTAVDICSQSPSQAAGAAADPGTFPVDPAGDADCPALCEKWVSFCKASVNAVKACFQRAGSSYVALKNAECAGDPATKEACKDAVALEKASFFNNVRESAQDGRVFCEGEGLTDCLATCN